MKLRFRGFADGKLIFDDLADVTWDQLSSIALKQALRLYAYDRHMIEIEFLDEPDPKRRFFRIGNDPADISWADVAIWPKVG